ncbi:protein kinase domain-containing protein [Tunturiibacter lichenicola]|uniref:serine/threonine-protein kinase n=1 Tax=Tunturiibacter lichenicola TaxID=2051959 RepID=UPI003D9BDD13
MIPEAGQRFGPYEILGRLGSGGMGIVFRAWDERLHREVAVKILQDSYKMPGMRERFLQEARAASGLNHPNICTIFDIGEQDGDPYLVMELLEGETLNDRIARGALSADEIVRYAVEVTDALTVAHAKGIVHRDIKPANIFLVKMPNGKCQAKVLDFGLAKIGLEMRGGWESRSLDLTLAGATVGTVAYMSPEQARGEPLDLRSDFFSLGVVMYEMATRRIPFEGTTSALAFVQLFNQIPDPVRDWNDSIPRDLERLILKLMTKDRRARFQTAPQLHDALIRVGEKVARGRWLHKGVISAVPLVRTADPVARRRRRKAGRALGDAQGEKQSAMNASASSFDRRDRWEAVTERDRGAAERRSSSSAVGSVKVESGETQPHIFNPAAGSSDPSINAAEEDTDGDPLVAGQSWGSRSLISQVEYGVKDGLHFASPGSLADADEIRELVEEHAGRARARIRMGLAVSAAIVAVAGVFLLARSGFFRPIVLESNDRLLLTVIQNKTSDKALDGTVMEGLEIALRQSKSLDLLGGEAYRAGLRQIKAESGNVTTMPEQRVAQKVRARAYLYGEITGPQAPYTISVEVLEADSNDQVASLEETAASREEIPAAIGRLAKAVRAEVSEDSKADLRRSVSLERDASPKVDALHAYAMGEVAMRDGRWRDALMAYQQSAVLDPGFVQAQLRLSWLYHDEKAEVAAANAATAARDASVHADEKVKLLAKFSYEMNASGDTDQAANTIRNYIARFPLDVDGMKGGALVLRTQGDLLKALKMAQQGYGRDPFDAQTYAEAELALIGLGRYDDVLKLEAEAKRAGVFGSANALTAGYLVGRDDLVAGQVDGMRHALKEEAPAETGAQVSYAEWNSYGLYMDNTGRLSEGREIWRTTAASASVVHDLAGTQAYLLAQGALDRALAESCTAALQMADEVRSLPKGVVASFNAGMAAALCGDEPYAEKTIVAMTQSFPQNTAVAQYYVPELQAAAKIGVNEPARSIQTLNDLSKYDAISMTPYLRGVAHAALGQTSPAILDFQVVLARHGSAWALQGNIFPMAELGEARAYAASRNKPESVKAYQEFVRFWDHSDRKQALMNEASVRSK